jgi:hypothetical protein
MDRGASNGVTAELLEEAEIQWAEKIRRNETKGGFNLSNIKRYGSQWTTLAESG